MASVPVSVDALSKDERVAVVAALDLKRASVIRAAKAEKNPAIAELRDKEVDALNALIRKFS